MPLLNQLLPRPSDTDVQQINDRVNETLIVAKEGHDKLGQSHLREGRQKFMAVEKLQAVDVILKRAGSSIQVLKKKAGNHGRLAICLFYVILFRLLMLRSIPSSSFEAGPGT